MCIVNRNINSHVANSSAIGQPIDVVEEKNVSTDKNSNY